MTKKEFIEQAMKDGGVKGKIFTSKKKLKSATGPQFAAILRASDHPVRSKHKTTYKDQEGIGRVRRKLYECSTIYNVVLNDNSEEAVEALLEGFLANLRKGFYDDDGNWVGVTPVDTDWVDEEDSVLKGKVTVQVIVLCQYGIYEDREEIFDISPAEVTIERKQEEITDGSEER